MGQLNPADRKVKILIPPLPLGGLPDEDTMSAVHHAERSAPYGEPREPLL